MINLKRLVLGACISFFSMPTVAGTNILFIGDSHSVGPFGWKLDSLMRTLPETQVATYASCGSIAKWWWTGKATTCGYYFKGLDAKATSGTKGPTPIFTKLLDDVKPNVVVVELGANYAGYADAFSLSDMGKVVAEIKKAGAKCFWITKPDARKNPEDIPRILDLTYRAVDEYCEVFDSTKVTKYPATGGDGIHYWSKEGTPIANSWAQSAFEAFETFLKAE